MAKKLTSEERKRRAAEKRLQDFLGGFPGLVKRMLDPKGADAKRSPKRRAVMVFKLLDRFTMSARGQQETPPELAALVSKLDALIPESHDALGAPEEVDPHELFLLYFELGLESQRAFDAWARSTDQRERDRYQELGPIGAKGKADQYEQRDERIADSAREFCQKGERRADAVKDLARTYRVDEKTIRRILVNRGLSAKQWKQVQEPDQ